MKFTKKINLVVFIISLVVVCSGFADAKTNKKFYDALKKNDGTTVEKMLKKDRGLANAEDDIGHKPLMIAAMSNYRKIAEILIANGADINARDKNGWTPLMYASLYRNPEIINLLLEKGADVTIKNNDGKTAIMVASKYGDDDILISSLAPEQKAAVEAAIEKERQEELARKEAEEKARQEAEELAKKEAEERERQEREAKRRYRAEDFKYTITKDGKGVRITDVVGDETGVEVTIPATIEGLPVTEVELGLHHYDGSSPKILKGFECSSNIKRIRFDGIVDCVLKLPSCRSLDFGECEFVNTTLTLIKEWNGAEDLYFGESNIEKLIIQEGFKVIRNGRHKRANSFNGCKKLKEIVVPGTVKMIDFRGEEEWLFGMEYVDGQQFRGCTSLPIRAQALLRQLGYKGEF